MEHLVCAFNARACLRGEVVSKLETATHHDQGTAGGSCSPRSPVCAARQPCITHGVGPPYDVVPPDVLPDEPPELLELPPLPPTNVMGPPWVAIGCGLLDSALIAALIAVTLPVMSAFFCVAENVTRCVRSY